MTSSFAKLSSPLQTFLNNGRERGIRTPGGLHLNGFQDRRFRPLSHLPKISHLEATPGFEPGIRALQARALPLGYAALTD